MNVDANANANVKMLLKVIDKFISGDISACEFEKRYMSTWRNLRDSDGYSKLNEAQQIFFDRIFTTLDAYCAESEFSEANDLDDEGLFTEVVRLSNAWKRNLN